MRYRAFATDYDETLACEGRVQGHTIDALIRARDSGRVLILVTGRELPNLRSVFAELGLFTLIVAENGTLLYSPATGEETALCGAPPSFFIQRLRNRGVQPLSVGRCVVATLRAYEATVLETIHELRLDLQVIFNREAVMVLPVGVDKGTGLEAALLRLSLKTENAVGIGDAENDLPLLRVCGFPVAVANAAPCLKQMACLVTAGSCGVGVAEAITTILTTDQP